MNYSANEWTSAYIILNIIFPVQKAKRQAFVHKYKLQPPSINNETASENDRETTVYAFVQP